MKRVLITCFAFGLLMSSCVDGYKDEYTWASSTQNTQMESPAEADIKVTFNADFTEQVISWPLVAGAGGYEINAYVMDDPQNPTLLTKENQVADKPSITLPASEDTDYKFTIRTLGNDKVNNTTATTTTEKLYSNKVPLTATIPAGDITAYFNSNPIPADTTWLCYELTAGADYTLTGKVNIGATPVVFRSSSKLIKANVAVSNEGTFVNAGAGLKLQYLDMDYSSVNSEGGATLAVIQMDADNFPHPSTSLTSGEYVAVLSSFPIVLQSCNIKNLKHYIFHDGNKKYGIGNLVIKDCVISHDGSFGNAAIRFQGGTARSIAITNSTFYNKVADVSSSMRFMQFNTGNRPNAVNPVGEAWTNCNLTVSNCTFWQSGKGAQSFNSNGFGNNAVDQVIVTNNIFVDSYETGRIISRFRRGNATAIYSGGKNTQWFDGADAYPIGNNDNPNGTGSSKDVDVISTDPQLRDPVNGDFTVQGAEQITFRTGDPRWLPAQ